jgi:hypothetical protein
MGFALDKIVPWGRSYEEYVSMFGLTKADLGLQILGCGDGPAGFNSTLTKRGGNIISVDPIYGFNAAQIRDRIYETYEIVMEQMRNHQNNYVWGTISSIEQLGKVRMSAMETFLTDFNVGKQENRYVEGELPLLPFKSGCFDIALSSHFLFLYSAHLSVEFHLQALQEMLRVSNSVRVFPLLALDGSPSPYIPFVNEYFTNCGFRVDIERVPYEFQQGANEMLVIKPVY